MNRTLRIAATATALALSLTACTSSRTTAGSGSGLPTSGAAADSSTPAPTTAAATPTPTPASSTAAPTASATASGKPSAAVPAVPGCTVAHLQIRAIEGSGFQGREFAQVVFTNTGTAPCSLYGFPGVSLRLSGRLLGQPATREQIGPQTVVLRTGQQASADITDFSTCNAPLSDTVRVYPPNSTQFIDLPLQLRGCQLSVKPVVAA